MDLQVLALEVEQPARAAEIMQEMTINGEGIDIFADTRDDMQVPDLGQHRATRLLQDCLPLGFFSAIGGTADRRLAQIRLRIKA